MRDRERQLATLRRHARAAGPGRRPVGVWRPPAPPSAPAAGRAWRRGRSGWRALEDRAPPAGPRTPSSSGASGLGGGACGGGGEGGTRPPGQRLVMRRRVRLPARPCRRAGPGPPQLPHTRCRAAVSVGDGGQWSTGATNSVIRRTASPRREGGGRRCGGWPASCAGAGARPRGWTRAARVLRGRQQRKRGWQKAGSSERRGAGSVRARVQTGQVCCPQGSAAMLTRPEWARRRPGSRPRARGRPSWPCPTRRALRPRCRGGPVCAGARTLGRPRRGVRGVGCGGEAWAGSGRTCHTVLGGEVRVQGGDARGLPALCLHLRERGRLRVGVGPGPRGEGPNLTWRRRRSSAGPAWPPSGSAGGTAPTSLHSACSQSIAAESRAGATAPIAKP